METINDIVREMRERDDECGNGCLDHYADRIEKAFIECVVNMDLSCIVNKQDVCYLKGKLENASDTFQHIMDENARLKAALKPVLEVNFSRVYGFGGYSVIPSRATGDVVLEAQRIYNEGAKR